MQPVAASLLTLSLFCFAGGIASPVCGDDGEGSLLFSDDFENGVSRWRSPDPSAFRIEEVDGNQVLHQFRQSHVQTPVRSPFNRAVVSDLVVGSFQMDVRLRSTARDYPHRSLCLFFGYQDPAHLYYVHLGQRTDDHANQIFIVNDAPRVKISTKTTEGTPWDDQWHDVRVVRNVESGEIRIYFDDMEQPVMTAQDKAFRWGRVGVGSFDDTGMFDDFRLQGEKATPAAN